jgi:hypothetical protein
MSDSQATVIDTYQDTDGNSWYLYTGGTQVVLQWNGSSNTEAVSSTGPFSTAQEAYSQLVSSLVPLPQDVQDFIEACSTLASKITDIATTATQAAASVDIAAHYVELIGDALIALVVIPGVGPALAATGAAIREGSIATEDVAAQVMQVSWQGLVKEEDITNMSINAWTMRAVPEGAWSYLQQIGESTLSPMATSIRQLLNL